MYTNDGNTYVQLFLTFRLLKPDKLSLAVTRKHGGTMNEHIALPSKSFKAYLAKKDSVWTTFVLVDSDSLFAGLSKHSLSVVFALSNVS